MPGATRARRVRKPGRPSQRAASPPGSAARGSLSGKVAGWHTGAADMHEALVGDRDIKDEHVPGAVFAGGERIASGRVQVSRKGRASEQEPAMRTGDHGEASEQQAFAAPGQFDTCRSEPAYGDGVCGGVWGDHL